MHREAGYINWNTRDTKSRDVDTLTREQLPRDSTSTVDWHLRQLPDTHTHLRPKISPSRPLLLPQIQIYTPWSWFYMKTAAPAWVKNRIVVIKQKSCNITVKLYSIMPVFWVLFRADIVYITAIFTENSSVYIGAVWNSSFVIIVSF